MSTSNILSLRFLIRKDKAKDNYVPVYARVTVDNRSADISLKRDVHIDTWNSATKRRNGKSVEDRAFNSFLEQIRTDLNNTFQELKYKNPDVTAEAIKNRFCGVTTKEQGLQNLIEYHNNHLKHMLEWGTMKNYITTHKYVSMFLKKKYHLSDIPLSRLSYTFLVDFEIFLREHRPTDHQRPCGNNTVMKHIERLRKMINVAIKNEWLAKDPFIKFQRHFIRKDRQILSQEDLNIIEGKDLPMERLRWARDLFVFSCYTGLAYCDVMSLTEQNLTRGIDGEHWINTERKKSHQSVRLPILPKAWEILCKYRNDPRAKVKGTLFATMSNQKLNGYLKEIAAICGIHKNLTFHLARHTFATTVTLSNDVPIETVSKMLGHTTIRTTQIYAKVVEKKVSNDMSALRNKLAGGSGNDLKAASS
jgi:integrase